MYYDLEYLIETFKGKMNDLPIDDNGKHIITMEEIVNYLEYLINDDNWL